ADEVGDLRARLGLRLRLRLELARRLHRVPPAQDRGGRKAEADPDGSRGRLRPARAMSFRARLAPGGAGPVAISRVAASSAVGVLTLSGSGIALQIGRNLSEVNHTLHRITLYLILIAAGGILVAVALGLAVSRAALTPVRRLTETAETVTETGDLSQRIEVTGHDEIGRLAASFNTMLGALEESSRAQRQLVADASHELRTPLT